MATSVELEPRNLVVIMSDQHSRSMMGCYGHGFIKTPWLDELAAQGTRFSQCYTPSPVCIPARAAFATGRYIHDIGYWDNADPYDGAIESWHHKLRERGHEVVSIGKLHFRSDKDDYGFTDTILPMHVVEGKGDLMGLIREDLPVRGAAYKMARMAGPGESPYTRYDRDIAAHAEKWLQTTGRAKHAKPWVLYISFVCPHYPLTAPSEHYDQYYDDPDLPMPMLYSAQERPDHPFILDYSRSFNFDDYFTTEDEVRRAVAGYFGLCSFVDEQAGRVLRCLDDCGLSDSCRVIYTSDHGDALGKRGLWGKSTLYEETIGVPLIARGAGFPAGRVIDTPTTLLDFFPFALKATGEDTPDAAITDLPGVSLDEIALGAAPKRTVLSEYHGMGSTTAAFAIRHRQYKYVHYVKYPPQLFDLEADPHETTDLAGHPQFRPIERECRDALRRMLDPEDVDRRAKRRQAEQIKRHGGVDAVVARGDLGFTPPPGVDVEFN